MLSLRCVKPFPCEITWNGAKSSMPPSERAAVLEEYTLAPSSRFPADSYSLFSSDNKSSFFTFADDDGITYRPAFCYGVIDPSKLDPIFYEPKGTFHPGYQPPPNPELPDSMQPEYVPEYYSTETEVVYDSSIRMPFDSSPFSATWPNRFQGEGDWHASAFHAAPFKISFAVACILPFPFLFIAHLRKYSSVSRFADGTPDLSAASEDWFKFLNNLVYTPPFLIGYEITFEGAPSAGDPPGYSVESKVWNGDLCHAEDNDSCSFFCNFNVSLPVDERDDYHWYPFRHVVGGFDGVRAKFINCYTSALDKVKPEVTFFGRPQQPHLYNIVNPCK